MEAEDLQEELASIAEDEGAVIPLQSARVPLPNLLHALRQVGTANRDLHADDDVQVTVGDSLVALNTDFHLPPERVETLLTNETHTQRGVYRLDVKKPDYLGSSMWQFRLEDRVIDAKILHSDWVERFQQGSIELRPGDALLAEMLVEARLGAAGEMVSTHYYVARVLRVVHDSPHAQQDLPLTG